MLDPKVSHMVSKEFDGSSIVVFDEAHNIDNICIEALSVTVDTQTLRHAERNVRMLETSVRKYVAVVPCAGCVCFVLVVGPVQHENVQPGAIAAGVRAACCGVTFSKPLMQERMLVGMAVVLLWRSVYLGVPLEPQTKPGVAIDSL